MFKSDSSTEKNSLRYLNKNENKGKEKNSQYSDDLEHC